MSNFASDSAGNRVLDEDDQADVEEALQFLQGRWKEIGTQLHLRAGTLNSIRSQNLEPSQAMNKMIAELLDKNYNVERFGPPTWKKIVEAVEKPAGGGNVAQAELIAKNYIGNAKIKSSYLRAEPEGDRYSVDPVPASTQFTEPLVEPNASGMFQFPETDRKKVEVDGKHSKISFERFAEWPIRDKNKKVQFSFGSVPPSEGVKKTSVAGTYDMTRWPHGLAVIVNNEEFERHAEREGTSIDECNLIQTFRHLGYIVEVHRDCKAQKIKDIIEDIRLRDHSKYDSFICCILSHGNAGHIYGTDSLLLPLDDITALLSGDKCRTLVSKPKLFFMQACRGKQKDRAVKVEADSGETEEVRVFSDSGERVATDSDVTIPDAADFFFSYATPLNQVAWRDLDKGSWYVSELCKSLASYGTFASLLDMVTATNGQVAKGYSFGTFKQEPDFNSRLRKDVFFF